MLVHRKTTDTVLFVRTNFYLSQTNGQALFQTLLMIRFFVEVTFVDLLSLEVTIYDVLGRISVKLTNGKLLAINCGISLKNDANLLLINRM